MDKPPKFKKGDKVYCIKIVQKYPGYKVGGIYTITWQYPRQVDTMRTEGRNEYYYSVKEAEYGQSESAFVSIAELGELAKLLYDKA